MDTSLHTWFDEQYFFYIRATVFNIWTNMTEEQEEKTVILILSSNGQRTENAPVQIFQLMIVGCFRYFHILNDFQKQRFF